MNFNAVVNTKQQNRQEQQERRDLEHLLLQKQGVNELKVNEYTVYKKGIFEEELIGTTTCYIPLQNKYLNPFCQNK